MPRVLVSDQDYSIRFGDDGSGYAAIENSSGEVWDGTSSHYIFCRFKSDLVFSSEQYIIAHAATLSNRRYISITNAGQVYLSVGENTHLLSGYIRTNEWNTVILQTNASAATYDFYINGTKTVDAQSYATGTQLVDIGIGDNMAAPGGNYTGYVCDIVFGTGTLSSEYINNLVYNRIIPSTTTTHLKCNDGSGSTLTDSIGSNDADLYNTYSWDSDTPFTNRSTAVSRSLSTGRSLATNRDLV